MRGGHRDREPQRISIARSASDLHVLPKPQPEIFHMKTSTALLLLMFLDSAPAGPSPIEYEVSFPKAVHHEATIRATFRDLPTQPLLVRMSRSSPGRYRLHEFAKNVYDVSAVDSGGRSLPVERLDPHQWSIAGHDGTAAVTYTLFADHISGTYSAIDATHAHLNGPATWLWAPGLESRPIRVSIDPPQPAWSIATQLQPAGEFVFKAPHLQYLMDSPIEISHFKLRSWQVKHGSQTQTIRLAIHHTGTDEEVDYYARMIDAFVPEQAAIFGELPRFDFGTYTFIANYLPYGHGDAMEHRNSTTLCSNRSLAKAALPLLETASHEFFHVWNVERLRPRSLEPFDFTRANPSGELWFAEGFTNYYDGLVLHRAGLWSLDRYARDLSATVNAVVNSPATRFASPVEMSRRAPLTDRAVWVDPRNDRNTYLSYYTYGDAVALALDLTLRTQTNRTLDDYLRALWERFGREEIPYTNADLQTVLAETTSEAFARAFFDRYVLGLEVADYRSLLQKVGFAVRKSEPGVASFGDVKFVEREGRLVLDREPLIGHPLYVAGLSRGDSILTIDGKEVTGVEQINEMLDRHKPGDNVSIVFVQRLQERTATITLEEVRKVEVIPAERIDDGTLSASAGKRRDAWLRSRSGARPSDLCKRCPSCRRILPFDTEFCPYDAESLRIHLKSGGESSSDRN